MGLFNVKFYPYHLLVFGLLFFFSSCSSNTHSEDSPLPGVWQGQTEYGNIPYLILSKDEAHFVMEYRDLRDIRSCQGRVPLKINSDGQTASLQMEEEDFLELRLEEKHLEFFPHSEKNLLWIKTKRSFVDPCDENARDYCGVSLETWSQSSSQGEVCGVSLHIGCEDQKPGYDCRLLEDTRGSCICRDLDGEEWSCETEDYHCSDQDWQASCCNFHWVR